MRVRSVSTTIYSSRKTAQSEIKLEPGPSDPGTPPHTHARVGKSGRAVTYKTGKKVRQQHAGLLPASIIYGIDKSDICPDVIVGPSENVIGKSMEPHEHGGQYMGRDYPARPFMGPALGEDISQLPGLLSEEWGKVQ